eukprot:22195-Eustigmatos_ZCMA.PRE.1
MSNPTGRKKGGRGVTATGRGPRVGCWGDGAARSLDGERDQGCGGGSDVYDEARGLPEYVR